MRHDHLVEKHAKQLGLQDVRAHFVLLSGGSTLNDALLSGNVDVGASGVTPMIRLWAATRNTKNPVRGIIGNAVMPDVLVTINPKVKTIRDLTGADRIALPAVKISLQAITLEMAAAQVFGEQHYDKLDPLTVSMKHPDAMVAMISGKAGIDSHFGQSPYTEKELKLPHAHVLLSTFSVLGEPASADVLVTTSRFRREEPKLYKAVLEAQKEAIDIINNNKHEAALIYISETKSKFPEALIEKILNESKKPYSATPRGIMKYANFMHKIGNIKIEPESWRDMFFPEAYDLAGN
jgi:NitT/TauT family transport system substrate-binding protein